MRTVATLAILVQVCGAAVAADPAAQTPPLLPLFDGKSSAGWDGNLQAFRVQDGAIVGGQLDKPVPRNEYLCTTKTCRELELRLKFRLRGENVNAGVEFRSERVPGSNEMNGYQDDMGQHCWGCLYDERRHKLLAGPTKEEQAKLIRRDGWNDYVIRAEGPRIQLWLNGHRTVDYVEPDAAIPQKGVFGLQSHQGAASEAWYQDITIEVPPEKPQVYIPEPQPAPTKILIGAHHCPLWEADQPKMWDQVVKHPERTPALGFYSQENPEVADWETKWAVEHGISFFVYCWYRDGQGGPVKTRFSSAIHDALFKSRFASKIKFTIMWENQARGKAGVANEEDLLANLLPFWVQNYFRHPSYLKIDNKPLLFIYRPEFLVQDLGSVENVRKAFEKMRAACREAGFEGLYLLGEYRGLDPNHLRLMRSLGLDYTFAYCWHVQGNPSPQRAIAAQLDYITKTRQMGILPQVITVSQGWSGWHDERSIWKIPPGDYQELLRKAKELVESFPASELGSKMLLLDNWNEWSEGHYIAPHREYGFGYLDAVRAVFSSAPKEHTDLLPEQVGMGPYDQAYRRHVEAGYRPGATK